MVCIDTAYHTLEGTMPHRQVSMLGYVLEMLLFDGTVRFQQQAQQTSRLRILAGVHGGGLVHSLFLQPHSGVLEVTFECLSQGLVSTG